MKVVIPWICVFGLLVGCFYLYSTTKEDEKEIAKLHQDEAEVARLRADNIELKQLKLDNDELVKLRNDHEELLRLRGEAGQLQKQVKQLNAQLSTARVQTTVAQRNQQQATQLADENKNLRNQNETLQQKQAHATADACIHNLHLIEAAKELWAADAHKPQGSVPTMAELTSYLPNATLPVCPSGGTYNPNGVGAAPTCSIPGHVMPPGQ
jgi:hypothetical protein